MNKDKESIKKYHEFFESYMFKEVRGLFTGGKLSIDLNQLMEHDAELIEKIIESPREHINLIKKIIQDINVSVQYFTVEFKNLNIFNSISINKIREKEVDKIFSIKGMLKRRSTSMIKTTEKHYLCHNSSCYNSHNKIVVVQHEDKPRNFKSCPTCQSGLDLINEVKEDYIQLYVEELAEEMDNSAMLPESKLVEITGDIAKPEEINQFLVGSKVEVIGIVRDRKKEKQGRETNISDLYIEAININSLEEDFTQIDITTEDIEKITELSKKENILEILKKSTAPKIAGRDKIKEGTLLYIVGGTRKQEDEKNLIHILIIGNASLGKSKILIWLRNILPRCVYVSAENSTGAGLVGATVKDSLSGAWTLEAGALPLANNGYFLLDEFDKIRREEQTKLNEALEHAQAHINKAGIKGVLKTYAPCYAVANPKNGKFDESIDYGKQITFDKTLLSRFDLIYVLDGQDQQSENESIIDSMLGLNVSQEDLIEEDLLRKYLIYARHLKPKFPNELKQLIKTYFMKIQHRQEEIRSLDITYRQLGGLERMSEAYAKLRLSNTVNKEDVKKAIELLNSTLNKFSTSEIETGISNKSRNLQTTILQLIDILVAEKDYFTIEELESKLENIDSVTLNKTIDQLKKEAVIYEPQRNKFRRVV